MRIPRVYTSQSLTTGQTVELESTASRHLLSVLRLKPGATLVLFDASGREFEAHITTVGNRRARVFIGIERESHSESPLRITLAQGVSRGERMEYTLQKAVELGVTEIMPVLTEHSVVRLDASGAARKLAHWQQIVIGACEQSGRTRVPLLHAPMSFTTLLTQSDEYATKVLLDPQSGNGLRTFNHMAVEQMLLLAGPEGGLSETECAAARQAGFQSVRLGPRILRTETAALVALSALQFRWGDLG